MRYHFVNLVSWSYFLNDNDTYRKIHLDSISIVIIARLFGYRISRLSGFEFYTKYCESDSTIYLTAYHLPNLEKQIVLPSWKNISEVKLDEFLKKEISHFENIVIGISSPKQDLLGVKLAEEFPTKNIYCLGAALYAERRYEIFDRFFLNWLILLVTKPLRTFNKVILTVKATVLIIFSANYRVNFAHFLRNNFKKI